MKNDLLNILEEPQECLTEQQLLDYLGNRLDPEKRHAVEVHLSGCEFCSEALEGLAAMPHPEQLPVIIQQIHGQFRRELRSHQHKNKNRKYFAWLSLVVFILLLILLIAFFAEHYVLQRERDRREPPSTIQQDHQ